MIIKQYLSHGGISGKGKVFIMETIKEAAIFMKAQTIESTKTTWIDLHKTMKNSQKDLF